MFKVSVTACSSKARCWCILIVQYLTFKPEIIDVGLTGRLWLHISEYVHMRRFSFHYNWSCMYVCILCVGPRLSARLIFLCSAEPWVALKWVCNIEKFPYEFYCTHLLCQPNFISYYGISKNNTQLIRPEKYSSWYSFNKVLPRILESDKQAWHYCKEN